MVQLEPTATGAVQLLVELKSEGLAPPRETEEMVRGALPELATVRVCAGLDVPCVVAGKDGTGGERVRAGARAMPVPLRVMDWGEPGASSAISKSAMRWPAAVGLKTREMVQLAPGASGAVQLLVKLKSEGLGPERETEEMCRATFPELMTVNV